MPHFNEPSQFAPLSSALPPELRVVGQRAPAAKPDMPAVKTEKAKVKAGRRLGIPKLSIMNRDLNPNTVRQYLYGR